MDEALVDELRHTKELLEMADTTLGHAPAMRSIDSAIHDARTTLTAVLTELEMAVE